MLSIVVGNIAEDSSNRAFGLELIQLPPIDYKCLRVLVNPKRPPAI